MTPSAPPPTPPPAYVAPVTAPAPSPAEAKDRTPGDPAPNAVYAEALGNGLLYSIDYERMLPEQHLGLRAGVGFLTWKVAKEDTSGNLTLASFPVVVSYYLGPARHKLQLGLGATLLYVSASSDQTGVKYSGQADGLGLAGTAVVGYRYLPPGGGFTFGAGFTPLVRTGKGFLPWGGLSAGYAF